MKKIIKDFLDGMAHGLLFLLVLTLTFGFVFFIAELVNLLIHQPL